MVNGWERILLVRHAETEMAGRFCGQADPPLNDRGRGQAVALVTALRERPVEVVYASDLERAAATAEAIAADHEVETELRTGLREIGFGEWEGLDWAEIEARDGAYAGRWVAEFPRLPAPGGERFEVFERRVLGEMREIQRMAAGRSAAVVTHAGVLRVVLQTMCGVAEDVAWQRTRSFCCRVEGTEVRG